MHVSANFQSGNIEVLDAADAGNVRLAIGRDANSDHAQWFYFRAVGQRDEDWVFHITNAGETSYPDAWKDYRAVASYDRKDWFRVSTQFDDGCLTIRHRPEYNAVYYAYFAPYSRERHHDFLARCQTSPGVRLEVLGQSLDGEDLDMLIIGEPSEEKRICWITAGQHPGETHGPWWVEGFVDRLLDDSDPVARYILDRAQFFVIPDINPDGSRRGHIRTNAAGVNLNRSWLDPTMDRCPEVFIVRERMKQTGCDFGIDVHAVEHRPHVFIAGGDRIPSLNDRQLRLRASFDLALSQATPDYKPENAEPDYFGVVRPAMCASYLAKTYGCLALTLEMPFIDHAPAPDERLGWSIARCRHLGAACLGALSVVIEDLR